MKILFYEVRHLVQIFTSVHPILSVYIFTGSKTKKSVLGYYQDIQRPLLREEGDGAPASSGTQ